MRDFESLYDALHIAGYYWGFLYNANIVKETLKAMKEFMDKFT